MTNIIGAGVTVDGVNRSGKYTFHAAPDIQTLYLTNYGAPGVKYGEVATAGPIGLAVTLDTSADTQVKLAEDGDPILGRIEAVENRVAEGVWVATVLTKGGMTLPIATGQTVAVGDQVEGSTAHPGNVQTVPAMTATALVAVAANLPKANMVTSVPGDGTVVVLFR